ncbi:peptidase, M16 family protein [Algoriphagus sp.]|uniref:peptidase, M16 family protein n=1 Tax=Algoriphagus sp. TaxID=1872435 RepID=UPI003282CCDE
MKKILLVAALGLLAAPVTTQATLAEKEKITQAIVVNSVQEVIANYVKATGGEAKMKAIHNMDMNMQAEIQGMVLDISSVIDQQNQRLLNVTEMNGNVISRTVMKDGTAKVSAMGQEQTLTGEQLEAMKNQIYAFRELYLEELGITATYEGTAEVAGEQAHKLAFSTGGDADTIEYYSVATGLKLQTESTTAGTVTYQDYKEVDGLVMPMVMMISNSMLPMPLEAKITSIKFNQELDSSIFN